MADLNVITLTGVATREPKLRQKSGDQVKAEFSLEVDRPFYRNTGEPVSDLFLVDAWNDLGRWVMENITEGQRVFVMGTLNKERYNTRGGREHLTIVKAKYMQTTEDHLADDGLDIEALKADRWPMSLLNNAVAIVAGVLRDDDREPVESITVDPGIDVEVEVDVDVDVDVEADVDVEVEVEAEVEADVEF